MKKTYKGWMQSSHSTFSTYVQVNDEIDEDMYYYFMEVVPPLDAGPCWFLMGEAIDHDMNGQIRHDLFIEKDNKFYFKGPHNEAQIDEYIQRGMLT